MPEALAPAAAPVAPAAPPAPPAEAVTDAPAPAESAPATAPEGSKPDTDQDPEKQRGTRRFERRLDKAYRRAAEAEARASLFERQYNEARQQQQPPVDPSAPKLEQFKDIEEYAQAKAKHESERVLKERDAKQQSETRQQAQARLVEDWEAKAERADDKYDDFQTVVGDLKPTSPWAVAVMEAENAEDVAYYLGKNLKEAQRIAALGLTSQIREIGKIEAKLLATPPKPKTPSQAPAPITPLKGAAPVTSDVPTDKDEMRDWMRKRQKQVHGSRIK